MAKWCIYYSDGSTISSEDATPFSVTYGKRENVQVIIQPDLEHNWVTLSGYDYYMWDTREPETKWWGGDQQGLDYYLRTPGFKCVLFGSFVSKYKFREILNSATKDLGAKSGFDAIERKHE